MAPSEAIGPFARCRRRFWYSNGGSRNTLGFVFRFFRVKRMARALEMAIHTLGNLPLSFSVHFLHFSLAAAVRTAVHKHFGADRLNKK